jgi:hypothetical protein
MGSVKVVGGYIARSGRSPSCICTMTSHLGASHRKAVFLSESVQNTKISVTKQQVVRS